MLLLSCKQNKPERSFNVSNTITQPSHIIFIWLENKGYDNIIGNSNAPYINSLRLIGTTFTNTHGIAHPSQPNYFSYWWGSTHGVTDDKCFAREWKFDNVDSELVKVGKTDTWYSEGLEKAGSLSCNSTLDVNYVGRHNPTINYTTTSANQKVINKPFTSFPTSYGSLKSVVCVSPNLIHDMHSGTIKQGDDWVQANCQALQIWCMTHNSMFIIYVDESNKSDATNRIPVIAVGEHIKANYQSNVYYDHYSWIKTTCSLMNADTTWTDELINAKTINDIWK